MATPKSNGLPPAAAAFAQGRAFKPEAFRFRAGAGIELAAAAAEGKKGRFSMKGYSGVPFYHPFWGNTAIDLSSMKVKSQKAPILRDHDSNRIVGYSEKIEMSEEKGLVLEGVFSDVTPDGKEAAGLAAEGFPWEASVSAMPRSPASLEWVKEGEKTTVNGHELKGPGLVWRNTHLQEVSFVPVGADRRTSATSLSADADSPEEIIIAFSVDGGAQLQKEAIMPEPVTTPTPPAAPAAPTFSAADVAAKEQAARQAALAEERARIKGIREFAAPGQEAIAQQLIDEGKTLAEAQAALHADLKVKFSSRLEALTADPAPTLRAAGAAGAPADPKKPAVPDEAALIRGFNDVDETAAKLRFAADTSLKKEFFGSVDSYLAYLRAESRGETKTVQPRW